MRLIENASLLLGGGKSALLFASICLLVALTTYVANEPVCPIVQCDSVLHSHFGAYFNSISGLDLTRSLLLLFVAFLLNYLFTTAICRSCRRTLAQLVLLAAFCLIFAAISWSPTLSFNPDFRSVNDGKVVSVFSVVYFSCLFSLPIALLVQALTALLHTLSSKHS